MESWELFQVVCKKYGRKRVAREMGVSLSLVDKWCKPRSPRGSGTRNPLDRAAELYRLTRERRLVEWLCEQAGGYFVPNVSGKDLPKRELLSAAGRVQEAMGHFQSAMGEALKDSVVTGPEAQAIRKNWASLQQEVEGLLNRCDLGVFGRPTHRASAVRPAASKGMTTSTTLT